MRYEDWDILLFPKDSQAPIKEFKIACHVIPDTELSQAYGPFRLPAMTCFVPSLPPNTPFTISIHSWGTPEVSQFTKTYSKHSDLIKFEARVLVDGRLVASTSFDRIGTWPHMINTTLQFTKAGDLEPLRFPHFRRELLYQNHWNPADDTGRIKIVISEGFPRDSLTVPIERVKNVAVFSFQHAPIEILESNGIAWPNPQMWRRPILNSAVHVPTYQSEDGPASHAHSPRRRQAALRHTSQGLPVPMMPGMSQPQATNFVSPAGFMHPSQPAVPRSVTYTGTGYTNSSFSDPSYLDWANSVGLGQSSDMSNAYFNPAVRTTNRVSSSDTSMPDYLSTGQSSISDPMSTQPTAGFGMREEDCHNHGLKVPANTPTAQSMADASAQFAPMAFQDNNQNHKISADLANSLTHSLLNQPMPLPVQPHNASLPAHEVRGRKENRFGNPAPANASPADSTPTMTRPHLDNRDISQAGSVFGLIGGAPLPGAGDASGDSQSDISAQNFSGIVSRNTSVAEFGNDVTNIVDPSLQLHLGSNSEKGLKRSRHFTPASQRAIDEEDEPRRPSPRVRAATFVKSSANGEQLEP